MPVWSQGRLQEVGREEKRSGLWLQWNYFALLIPKYLRALVAYSFHVADWAVLHLLCWLTKLALWPMLGGFWLGAMLSAQRKRGRQGTAALNVSYSVASLPS